RNTGVLIAVPLALLYLYGPRADREPDTDGGRYRPRYRMHPDILWIALVPLGLVSYLVYLQLQTGHAFSPFEAQHFWRRSFIPLGGIPLGLIAAAKSVVAQFPGTHLRGTGDPL